MHACIERRRHHCFGLRMDKRINSTYLFHSRYDLQLLETGDHEQKDLVDGNRLGCGINAAKFDTVAAQHLSQRGQQPRDH